MKTDLLSYKTSLQLKKLGFNWGGHYHYIHDAKFEKHNISQGDLVTDHFDSIHDITIFNPVPTTIIAVPQHKVQRWLMKEHKIYVLPELCYTDPEKGWNSFVCCIHHDTDQHTYVTSYNTYIKALEAGIIKALELIKVKS